MQTRGTFPQLSDGKRKTIVQPMRPVKAPPAVKTSSKPVRKGR